MDGWGPTPSRPYSCPSLPRELAVSWPTTTGAPIERQNQPSKRKSNRLSAERVRRLLKELEAIDHEGDRKLLQSLQTLLKESPRSRRDMGRQATDAEIHHHMLKAFAQFPLGAHDRDSVAQMAWNSLQSAHPKLYVPLAFLRILYTNDRRYEDLRLNRQKNPRRRSQDSDA